MVNATRALFTLFLAAGLAVGQTPEGFSPAVSQQLIVEFGSTKVTPGRTLEKALTQTQPTIAVEPNSGLSGTYIFMMIDLDVPVRDPNTQNVTGRTHLLHALQPNFKASSNGTLISSTAASDAPAPYRGPSPPPENPPKPHRYTQLLFEQPANFSVPASQASSVEQRRGFNITSFIAAAGLSAPIRGNYFEVVNNSLSAAPTGTAASPTSAASPTASQFTGAANNRIGGALSGVLVAAAAFALL